MQTAGSQASLADRVGTDLYRANAFRVTGLPVEAKDREISRHLEKLRMAQRLGAATATATGLLPLTPAPSFEAIAEAAQRLRDPHARLLDQFFWFWADDEAGDQAMALLRSGNVTEAAAAWRQVFRASRDPTAQHNVAVLCHAMAVDLEHEALSRALTQPEEDDRVRLWREAIEVWYTLLGLNSFWAIWGRTASADSAMTAGLAAQFREGLPEALLAINAQLAIAAGRSGDERRAVWHGALLQGSGFDASSIEKARRRASQPLIHAIASLCKQCELAATGEPSRGRDTVSRLLADAASPLSSLAAILPRDHPLLNAAADQVMTTVQGPLVSYANNTHDWSGVLPVLAECFKVPGGDTTRARLEKDIATVVGNIVAAHTETVAKGRGAPQQALASLSSLVAWIEDVRKAGYVSGPACAELYDNVAQAACSVSVAQFKGGDLSGAGRTLKFALTLTKDPTTRAQIEQGLTAIANRPKRLSLRAAAGWIWLGLIGLGVLSSIFDSSKRGRTSTAGTPSAVGAQGSRPPSRINRTQLAQIEREINQGKAVMAQHERALEQLDRSLSGTNSEIAGLKAATEQMEQEALAGFEVDRSRYEFLVATHNEAVERHNATLARRRARYAQYQQALRATNAKVDAYNMLIR